MVRNIVVVISLFCAVVGTQACATSDTSATGDSENQVTIGGTTFSYKGSAECRTCHRSIYESWSTTLNTMKVTSPTGSSPGVVCDSDLDGTNDFQEGITLGDTSNSTAFASYFAAGTAPILSYDSATSTYKVTIGEVTYDVTYLLGGAGWKQRYMTRIGNSVYILPIQYNNATNEWVTYHPNDWWVEEDGTQTTTPIYAVGDTHVSKGNTADSWDKRCAGCHTTGLTSVTQNSDSEYITSYAELNVGCESCHGPGSRHIALGGGDNIEIVNPNELSFDRAEEVCGVCHGRGSSTGTVGTVTLGYPWGSLFIPGDILADFYEQTTTASKFWGDALDRSKGHHQQYIDQLGDAHAEGGINCFSCHDPHGSDYEHDLRLSPDDNSLCLSCHGSGQSAAASWASDDDISDHTFHNVDDDDSTKPVAGNGSRCIGCHMPKVAKSAVNYDIHTHNFRPIYPVESKTMLDAGSTPIPNACMNGVCHSANDQSSTTWSVSDSDDLDQATACISGAAACPDATFTGWMGGNIAPIASTKATSTSASASGGDITLDGSRSFDPNGDTITYSWVQSSGPSVTLSDATASAPTFTPNGVGTYVFSLVVNDGTENSNEATVTITVSE